jgi:Putative F0F1-ATPase subunit Ca2+/Mg2+ transporter
MSSLRGVGRYGTIGFELIIFMAVGFYGGRYLDAHYGGGRGIITLCGFALGITAGFRNLYKAAKALERDAEREERTSRGEMPYQDEYLEIAQKSDVSEAESTATKNGAKAEGP